LQAGGKDGGKARRGGTLEISKKPGSLKGGAEGHQFQAGHRKESSRVDKYSIKKKKKKKKRPAITDTRKKVICEWGRRPNPQRWRGLWRPGRGSTKRNFKDKDRERVIKEKHAIEFAN